MCFSFKSLGAIKTVVLNLFPVVAHRSGVGPLDRPLEKIIWVVIFFELVNRGVGRMCGGVSAWLILPTEFWPP